MNMEKLKYTDIDGTEKEADVVLCFEAGTDKNNLKKYVIYTFNETDEKGMMILYTSILKEENDKYNLESISNNDEWNMVKNIMKQVVVEWKED